MNRYVVTRFHQYTNKVTSLVVVSGVAASSGACVAIQRYPSNEHPLPPELEALLQLEAELNPDLALVGTFTVAEGAAPEPTWMRPSEQVLETDATLGFNYSVYYSECRELVDPVLRTDVLTWADSRAARVTAQLRLNPYVTGWLHRCGASEIGHRVRPYALNSVIHSILSVNT